MQRWEKIKIIAFLCIGYDLENLINIKKKLYDFRINISTNVNQIKSGKDEKETFTDSLDELLEKVFTKAQKNR